MVIKDQKHTGHIKPLIYNSAEKILDHFYSNVNENKRNDEAVMHTESDIEKKLIGIWCDVLKMNASQVDPNQNFFVGGANSFALIEMNSKLKDELDIDIELIKLFEYPTIRSLASYIESQTKSMDKVLEEKEKQNSQLQKNKQTRLKTLNALRRR